MPEFEEYANGACGVCAECGEPTDEEWHRLCRECYAAEQGWRRPDRTALAQQHEDRERVSITRLVERVTALETRVDRLEAAP